MLPVPTLPGRRKSRACQYRRHGCIHRHRHPRAGSPSGRPRTRPRPARGAFRRPAELPGHDHARRPDPRPHALQGRRQGPVRQGTRTALEDGRAHLAVHSLKDVPDGSARGLRARRVLEREDPRDAFVSPLPAAWLICRRAPGRHLEPAPLLVQLGAPARPGGRAAARQPDTRLRKLDAGPVRRHRARRGRTEAPRPRRSASAPSSRARRCCPAPARAPSHRGAPTTPSAAQLGHADARPPGSRCRPSARVARLGGSCSMPLAVHASWPATARLRAALGHPQQTARDAAARRGRGGRGDDAQAARGARRTRRAGVAGAGPAAQYRRSLNSALDEAARHPSRRAGGRAGWRPARARHRRAALPLIGIFALRDAAPVREAWASLAAHRLVMFVSPNAAEQFFALRPPGPGLARRRWPARPARHQPHAARAGRARGLPSLEPAADAAQFDSESLWQQLKSRDWRGGADRARRGRDWLADTLRAQGASVDFVTAYEARRAAPMRGGRAAARGASSPQAQVWMFSSSESIAQLEALRPAPTGAARPRSPPIRASRSARARPASADATLECRPSLDAVVACLQSIA